MHGILYNIVFVGLGSCLGGIIRYLVGRVLPMTSSGFPTATLIVNLVGCFIIGLIFGLLEKNIEMSGGLKLFLTVGFCGGFTTFSTFMYDNLLMVGVGDMLLSLLYTAISIIGGLLLVYAGNSLGNM